MKKISIAELKASLKDKTYRSFDGWSSSLFTMKVCNIRHSKCQKGYYELVGHTSNGNKVTVTLSNEAINHLSQFGEYETFYEIDHCIIRNWYRIG